MKVLMFGWEFPPNISGGLGTACYGLTKGLSSFNDVDLTFVVPNVYGNEEKVDIKLIEAGDVVLSGKKLLKQRELEMKDWLDPDQQVSAYITPEHYKKLLALQKIRIKEKIKYTTSGKFEFAGKYGSGLYNEISRYALVASEIAGSEPHNIIHVHDWLTYPAGIAARKVSGNPLVVHVHSTEFDRSGGNPNSRVCEIERNGMEIADRVITVSDFTRNIVIKKYLINPSKIITVHNAVESADDFNNWNTTSIPMKKRRDGEYEVTVALQKGREYQFKYLIDGNS